MLRVLNVTEELSTGQKSMRGEKFRHLHRGREKHTKRGTDGAAFFLKAPLPKSILIMSKENQIQIQTSAQT